MDQKGERKKKKCNVINSRHLLVCALKCVFKCVCVEASCRGVDQSVQRGSGLMALNRSRGTGHVF